MDTSLAPIPAAPLNITLNAPLNPVVDFPFDNTSSQYCRKVQTCFYDLSSGELGVLRASRDSYAVFVQSKKKDEPPQLKVRPVAALGLPISAYAIRTQIEDLKTGDLVSVTGSSSDTWFYYLGQKDGTSEQVKIENPSVLGIRVEDGVKVEITLSESINFTGYSVLCVKNLTDKQDDLKKFFPQLALLGAGGRDEESRDKLSKMILCLASGLDMKSILPMLALGSAGSNMLITAMLMQDSGVSG